MTTKEKEDAIEIEIQDNDMNDEVEMEKTIEEKRLVINKVQQDIVSMKPSKIQSDCDDTTQTNIDFNT